jgi:HK97 family phage portal protein
MNQTASINLQSIVCPVTMPFGVAPLLTSRSIENPAVPLSMAHLDDDLVDALTGAVGGKTSSGIRINRRKALGYSAVWRAVNLISRKIAALPIKVFKASGPGKEVDKSHPAYKLLRRRPNQYMTAVVFKETLQSHALLRGNGYAYVFRDADARPVELLILNPEMTWPIRVNGVLSYITEIQVDDQGQTERRRLRAEDVIHIRGLGFDGLTGYDVISILRETLAKAIATREHGSRFFSNNAKPNLALEFPAGMKDAAVTSVINGWERMNKGLENAHKIGILREGVKLHPFSTNARDSQLTENLAFDAMDIANVFGLPPRKLGLDQGGGYNSLFEENQSVHDDTLDPWCVTWEEELDSKLLTQAEQETESHSCLFVRNAVMRSNPDQRASFYEKMVENGLMNPDEARALEDMNPMPDGVGQKFYVKSGLTAVGADPAADPAANPATEPAPATDPSTLANSVRAEMRGPAETLLRETAGRMARRLATQSARGGDLAGQAEGVSDAFGTVLAVVRAAAPAVAVESAQIAAEMVEFTRKNDAKSAEFESNCVEMVVKTVFSEV